MDFYEEIKDLEMEELEKVVKEKIKVLEEASYEDNPELDTIGFEIDYNPTNVLIDLLNGEETIGIDSNCFYVGYARRGLRMVYGLSYGHENIVSNDGNYYYLDDDSYILEFCKYIQDKEVNNEYELFNYVLKFINDYFKKIKDIDRYQMFHMIKKSKRDYYDPIKEHKFSEFKGKGNAMCSEIAVVAGNILNVFGMDTHIIIGHTKIDGGEESAHAYNMISYKETETGENIDAIIDFSYHTEVCDINYKNIMCVPFIGEIEKLDTELVKKIVYENEILSFEDYFYMLLGNTIIKLGCQRNRNYYIGKEYEMDCKVIEKIKNK